MNDSISRQAAIDAIDKALSRTFIEPCGEMILKDLPSAQPEPKTGRWVKMSDSYGTYHCCSRCGREGARDWNYCPNCGACMKEESDERPDEPF